MSRALQINSSPQGWMARNTKPVPLAEKGWVITMKKISIILLSAVLVFSMAACNGGKEKADNQTEKQTESIKPKGGEGYGMFDKATRIEIIFNDNEYIVSNPDEIEQIIRLCRQNWEPSNTHITKEDCDMCVKFIGTDTEVWVDTETLSSYIGESFVQMPEDLFKKIKEVVSLSNTLRSMPIFQCIYKEKILLFSVSMGCI